MWLPAMLWWHVLNVTACGGIFCCFLWNLAGLTASVIRSSLLQRLGVSFFLDDRKAWTVATLFPEMSAFRCQGKCSGFRSALFLEATATMGSGLQLVRSASLLSLLLHITWQLAEHCGSAVPLSLFAPLPVQGKQLISGFICALFSVVVLAERLLGGVFLPFLLSFFMFMTWPAPCLTLWLKRGEVCVRPWILGSQGFLESWSKLKEIFFPLIWVYSSVL